MSGPQPNVWQTASKSRTSQSTSRNPQSRSNTGSPNPQAAAIPPPPRQDARPQQVQNVWASRSSSAGGSNGPARSEPIEQQGEEFRSVNMFDGPEVARFLGREAQGAAVYKMPDGNGVTRPGGAAWGSKPNYMANNQPFFVHLAKQVATAEGGG